MNPEISQEFVDGYLDGSDKDNPEPGENRSPAYRHSFRVRRAEMTGNPIRADHARKLAELAELQMLRGQL